MTENRPILIVDDNPANLQLLGDMLRQSGFDVCIATNGLDAIRIAESTPIGLILLDILMPGMDGHEVCVRLKSQRNTAPIPVIFISAVELASSKVKAFRDGAVDYITKPFQAEEVVARINTHLQLSVMNELKAEMESHKRSIDALRKTQNLAHIGTWVWHTRTNTIEWSDEMYHIFGISKGSFRGDIAEVIEKTIHPDDRAKIEASNRSVVLEHKPIPLEYRVIWPNGEVRTVWAEAAELTLGEDGNTEMLSGMVQDITERKASQSQNDYLQAQLVQAQKMESIGRLAGGVAHDFNNMLGVMRGHAEFALNRLDPREPLYDDLSEIVKAAKRAGDLTRQLLAFARKDVVSPKVLDLNETIGGMLKMLQRLIGEEIHISWKPHNEIWNVRIDPSQIDQILANLCVNARDAIENTGTIIIATENINILDSHQSIDPLFIPGEYVKISLSDDGCGMDRETLLQIFEPFYTTKGIGKGTGLGLATVYGIVKQNNGFVKVYSEPNQGTTFSIYLPRYQSSEHIQDESSHADTRHTAKGSETILIVEDEPSILDMAQMFLEGAGYHILTASSPKQALAMISDFKEEIKMVISDVIMPEMNGKVMLEQILLVIPNVKYLFMSGYTADIIAKRGVLDEDVHFLQKPFSPQDLTHKVRQILDEK